MIPFNAHVLDRISGETGRVINIHKIEDQGNLAVIRLDREHPVFGRLTTAWETELEIILPEQGRVA